MNDKPKTTMYLVSDDHNLGQALLVDTEDLDKGSPSVWARYPTASRGFSIPMDSLRRTKIEALAAQFFHLKSAEDHMANEMKKCRERSATLLELIVAEAGFVGAVK